MFETLFVTLVIFACAAIIFKVCFDLVSLAFALWLNAPSNGRDNKIK